MAAYKDVSLGDAIAELVRQGLRPPPVFEEEDGIRTLVLPKDTPIMTLEQTLAFEDDLD